MIKRPKKFNFEKGDLIADRYVVQEYLGRGFEGEVYRVRETHTNFTRAIKLFYSERDIRAQKSRVFIKKLNRLRSASMVMDYYSNDFVMIDDKKVACVVCEYIKGESLAEIIKRQRRKRFGHFEALHLLYAIVKGVESIHLAGEYHGDLHLDNILIRKFGLNLDLKVIDLHHWGDSKKDNREEDIIKIIHIFYEVLGGRKTYAKHPQSIKSIIKGLRRDLILQEFKTITHLRGYLETMEWEYGD